MVGDYTHAAGATLEIEGSITGLSDRVEVTGQAVLNGGTVSVQVLNDIANVARRKMRLGWAETIAFVERFRLLLNVVPITETHAATGFRLLASLWSARSRAPGSMRNRSSTGIWRMLELPIPSARQIFSHE